MWAELSGKKVLVVDDDFRNIFAMRALLEASPMPAWIRKTDGTLDSYIEKMYDIQVQEST